MPTDVNVWARDTLKARLLAEGAGDLAATLDGCGEVFEMTSIACGHRLKIEKGCKKRWCPCCAPKLSAERIAKYSFGALMMKWPLAVTLTSSNTLLAAGSIRAFRKALTKFRRTKLWGGTVKGGILSIEVTNTGKGWHVHAHLLLDCAWLSLTTSPPRKGASKRQRASIQARAHRELSAAWAACLGQASAVVWVERAWGKALLETIKYAVKPSTLLNSKDPIAPIIREMHRLQLVNGFGTCYGLTKKWKNDAAEQRGPCLCHECGAPTTMIPTDILNMKLRSGCKWI